MAQYYTDFSNPNAASEWTSRWASVSSISVQSEGTENYLEIISGASSGRFFVSWDTVPSAAQVNVLMRVSGSTDRRIFARGSGAAASETGWMLGRRTPNDARVARYVNGELITDVDMTVFVSATSDMVFSEANLDGSSLQWREWLASDPAPDWMASTDSSAISGAGQTGIFFFEADTALKVWSFAVGTDGDPAPAGPVSFLLRHNPRTNKVIPVLSSPTVTDIGANCVRPRVTKGY